MGTLSEITCILNYLIQIRPVWSQISSINSGEVIPSWRLCPEPGGGYVQCPEEFGGSGSA